MDPVRRRSRPPVPADRSIGWRHQPSSVADPASAAGRAGAIARVYWTYQDGTSDKEEEKPVAGDIVNFSFSQADGMQPGAYNVQIDIDDVPVGIADFQVQ